MSLIVASDDGDDDDDDDYGGGGNLLYPGSRGLRFDDHLPYRGTFHRFQSFIRSTLFNM